MKEKYEQLDRLIHEHLNVKGPLMPVLQGAQDIFGAIPEEIQLIISKKMNIPLAEIYGVITFYSQFRQEQRGENIISVCMGTACYVKGSQNILDIVAKDLDISVGQTTKDNMFTLEATRCIGACGLAPIISINDRVYAKVKESELTSILEEFIQEAK